MKKDTILISLSIGLAVFLMRWVRAFTPIENYEIHFLPLFGIYWGMKLHFNRIKKTKPDYNVTLIRAMWLGLRMSFIASIFTGLLCFLFVQYPKHILRMFPPLFLHSVPFISTVAYGVLITIICSAVYVYCKPEKFHIKWHTGHLLY
jgi:hypothetical protein